jgi:hypothetical protein
VPITQISRIQQRRGLQENLPQLASGELGWAVDTRKLYIGNGTIEEGAPSTGVTEILTQYSPLNYFIGNTATANVSLTLTSNNPTPQGTTLTIDNNTVNGATVDYIMKRTIASVPEIRKGTVQIGFLNTGLGGTRIAFDDTYVESANLGVILSFANTSLTSGRLEYTTSNIFGSGNNVTFTYNIKSILYSL